MITLPPLPTDAVRTDRRECRNSYVDDLGRIGNLQEKYLQQTVFEFAPDADPSLPPQKPSLPATSVTPSVILLGLGMIAQSNPVAVLSYLEP